MVSSSQTDPQSGPQSGPQADQPVASPELLSQEGSERLPAVTIATEKLDDRSRRIRATVMVPCSLEHLWSILTDYDRLATFIPNLTLSRRIDHPQGGIRLEQVGAQCFLNIQFCARVVLDMVEQFPYRLGFDMVEGDFRRFQGSWCLEPVDSGEGQWVRLVYEVTVLPPRAIPAKLIEHHLRRDLTVNLRAIFQRAIAVSA